MLSYVLTKEAEQGLRQIARYTLKHWGKDVLNQYRSGLEATFKAISNGEAQSHSLSNELPDIVVTKYRYHFVFYIEKKRIKPVIIGVIHEKRDIVSRLAERLKFI
tara:strand:+ start:14358 stop:14672 length:315 start_codon:yes stop_codon:yes gene_type:complete